MIELYFLIFRIPKMMTQLARERNRSALAWSLIAIGAWIGSELFVGLIYGLIQAIGIEFWGWPENPGLSLAAYVCAAGRGYHESVHRHPGDQEQTTRTGPPDTSAAAKFP